jgi:transposase
VLPAPAENQECFLEGLKRLFEQIGGVPERIWFDNLSAAVIRVENNGDREVTEAFRRFSAHYRFEAVFCNPASGHEKGHVGAT